MNYLRIFLFALLYALSPLCADQIDVTNLLDSGSGSFREALINALEDDEIVFNTSLSGTLTLGSNLPEISESIHIFGPPSGNVTISGNTLYSVFNVSAEELFVNDLHITAAKSSSSGAGLRIANECEISLSNVSFRNCTGITSEGGAIRVGTDATLSATNISFSGNTSGGNGKDIWFDTGSTCNYQCSSTVDSIEIFGNVQLIKEGTGTVSFVVPSSSPISFVVKNGEIISTGIRSESSFLLLNGSLCGEQTMSYCFNCGSLKPSKSIGVSVVTGTYHQDAFGTLKIGINPTQNDLLDVGSNAILSGKLEIVPEAGSYIVGTTYTILVAGEAISGTFDTITSTSMMLNALYYPNRIDVVITQVD